MTVLIEYHGPGDFRVMVDGRMKTRAFTLAAAERYAVYIKEQERKREQGD